MPDFRDQLPPFLRERYGQWVSHDYPAPGVVRHVAADGTECWTLRLHLPPAGMLSSSTLRLLARWISEYARVGRRTSRQGFELVGVDPLRLAELVEQVRGAGFLPGGAALRQVKACTGYLHCQNAAVDSPSLARVLGEALLELAGGSLPAGLRVSVSGCPNDCGGAQGADLGLVGWYGESPRVRLYAGGRAGLRPRLARSLQFLPARAPGYAEVVERVAGLVERWRREARTGERLGEWLARTGGSPGPARGCGEPQGRDG